MINIYVGDCLDKLKHIESQSIDTCVTSPPYWGLRDYGEQDQLGLEDTPEEFVENLVNVFREVKRVLKDDGTIWLNLGDSYLPNKQLGGIPWRVAFALQQDGWYLRQDIIWHKPGVMPESCTDRCTKAHEYIFFLSKQAKYYYDNEAIKEKSKYPNGPNSPQNIKKGVGMEGMEIREGLSKIGTIEKRNKRSVWTVATKPFKEAHFATFPMDLIEPCVLAGCREGGTVLDPFAGSGTTGIVASMFNRKAILIELNKKYVAIMETRMEKELGFFVKKRLCNED